MEMHQVRYFLAVARTLNFTRAADECNVAQPSLTRAIKLLEGELGGDLFRRERPRAMLTPLGERMYPAAQAMLRQRAERACTCHHDQRRRGRRAQTCGVQQHRARPHPVACQRTAKKLQRDRAENPARHRPASCRISQGRRCRACGSDIDRRSLGPPRQLEAV